MLILHPVSDLYYYGAALIVMALCGWNIKGIIDRYNLLATRKLPQFNKRGGAAVLLAALLLAQPLTADAKTADTVRSENSYRVVIEDAADLLTDEEERQLAGQMAGITEYGGAAFQTISHNNTTTDAFARASYAQIFGQDSGMLFLIDMDNRKIWIYCDGDIYRTITRNYADTITDNVYAYASKGEYYRCASEAFAQALTLLEGGRIAQPMKIICNALLAFLCALLLNFIWVSSVSRAAKTSDKELLAHIEKRYLYSTPTETFLRKTKRYSPVSRDSGGFSDSGGGGGGESSGGGGGHSF